MNAAPLYRLRLAETIAAGDVTPMMIFPIGEWHSARYPDLPLTEDLAHELIANFEAGILGTEPVVDSSGKHDTSAPAAGWVKRVYLASYEEGTVTGMALWADVEWTSLGATLLSDNQYKYGSVEIGPVTMNEGGDTIDNVLRSLTLTNTPVLRIMPGVKNAKTKQRVVGTLSEIVLTLSEVTLADAAVVEDPMASLVADLEAVLNKADSTLKGKPGVRAIRTYLREVLSKASAHALDEDDGNPAEPNPASSEPVSQPAKGDEGQPVTLAEGDAATKGVDPHMDIKTLTILQLSEGASDEAVQASILKLAEERDAEKTAREAADMKLAETEKAGAIATFAVKLDEKIKADNTIAPGEREHYMKLAERDVELAEDEIVNRTHKVIDTIEHGDGKRGSAGTSKRADVELAEKVRARVSKDGCGYPIATSLVLSENPDLKARYDEFRAGKEG